MRFAYKLFLFMLIAIAVIFGRDDEAKFIALMLIPIAFLNVFRETIVDKEE